jgi:hypothetical protein
MMEAHGEEHRAAQDRRMQPTSVWSAFCFGGRRMHNRRTEEHCLPYHVDRFSASSLGLILALLIATILDGLLTLHLLDSGCEEINPLMSGLLRIGVVPFLLGKYIMTAAGLPLLLIFKNFYLFHTRFRVGYLLPIFVILYLLLLAYQAYLCRG